MHGPLARYCAYWFVAHRLSVPTDTDPPRDETLSDVDCVALAGLLVEDVNDAELKAGEALVELDPRALLTAATTWQTMFEAADSVLSCARRRTPSEDQVAPKAVIAAFSDYIVTRWIFRELWHYDARTRPTDREFPPPFRNADAKRGLAEALASNCARVGT